MSAHRSISMRCLVLAVLAVLARAWPGTPLGGEGFYPRLVELADGSILASVVNFTVEV